MQELIPGATPIARQVAIRAWRAADLASSVHHDYQRARHLPRLIAVGPDEVADQSGSGRRRILRKLARAIRGERSRAGHWTYDLNRHLGLVQAYRAEMAALTAGRG